MSYSFYFLFYIMVNFAYQMVDTFFYCFVKMFSLSLLFLESENKHLRYEGNLEQRGKNKFIHI